MQLFTENFRLSGFTHTNSLNNWVPIMGWCVMIWDDRFMIDYDPFIKLLLTQSGSAQNAAHRWMQSIARLAELPFPITWVVIMEL